jgi:lipopolysaccharide biosynthesis glycosyltransferase
MLKVFIGWDRRELAASQVCARSLVKHASMPLDVRPLILPHLQACGLYTRPTKSRNRFDLWDEISQHRMATDHAISRFLVPHLAGYSGWALSCDGDILYRADVAELFGLGDPKYAVMVVKHDHQPREMSKMDGQVQAHYERKNWSSVVLWNCAHPANKALTLETVNTARGLWLHRFDWLKTEEIGELPPAWNFLVGYTEVEKTGEPKAAHFTNGTPDMGSHMNQPYADEWRGVLREIQA